MCCGCRTCGGLYSSLLDLEVARCYSVAYCIARCCSVAYCIPLCCCAWVPVWCRALCLVSVHRGLVLGLPVAQCSSSRAGAVDVTLGSGSGSSISVNLPPCRSGRGRRIGFLGQNLVFAELVFPRRQSTCCELPVASHYLLSNFVQSASIIYLGVIAQFVGGFDCSMMIAV